MMHSFTDEQLLNLVNNTIKTKTDLNIKEFTGGSVQITSINNHQLLKCRVSLFFGYHNRNAIVRTIDIKEEYLFIWQSALLLKAKSLQVSNSGMDISELNELMNTPSSKVVVVSSKVVSKGSTNIVRTSYEVDAELISDYLESKILKENKNIKTNPRLWDKDIEKCLRIDGRTKEQLISCIDWIYSVGKFWIPNVMSGKKLREKFDRLNLEMNQPKFKQNKSLHERNTEFMNNYFKDDAVEAEVLS